MIHSEEKTIKVSNQSKITNWSFWNKLMFKTNKESKPKFKNYGFHHLTSDKKISLLNEDENDRYFIQLYDHIMSKVDPYHKDILEIESKCGGGASYINRYYDPKSYTGVEQSSRAIEFCNSYYIQPDLSFIKSDPLEFSLNNQKFDIVLSVQSKIEIENLNKLANLVYDVINSKGIFLYANIIETRLIETVKHHLRMGGFSMEYKEDLTQNIVSWFNKDYLKANDLVKDTTDSKVNFKTTKDIEIFNSLISGDSKYMSFILRKIN